MQSINTSELAERIMNEIDYAFDCYYTQDCGNLQLEQQIKNVIDNYIKENNKRQVNNIKTRKEN
jgi:hypothetical protein